MSAEWRAVTIIVPQGYAEAWALNIKDLRQLTSSIKRLLKKHAPDAMGWLVVDVSFNVESHIDGIDHWQIHFHCIVKNVSPREWEKVGLAIAKDGGQRRLYVKDVTDPIGQLAYMAKPNFARRVSIFDHKGRRNTRIEPLSADQELELAEWLSSYQASSRIIRIG